MPTRRPTDEQKRFEYLESIGRRCLGNNGHCINTAVDEFDVIPAVDGEPVNGSDVVTLKTCGRHRIQVLGVAQYYVVRHRRRQLSADSAQSRAAVARQQAA